MNEVKNSKLIETKFYPTIEINNYLEAIKFIKTELFPFDSMSINHENFIKNTCKFRITTRKKYKNKIFVLHITKNEDDNYY